VSGKEPRISAESDSDSSIHLTLQGSAAADGISLRGLRTFLEQFLSVLRDHDRDRQGEATRTSGSPGQRGAAATAFRVVRRTPGSAVLTVEPEVAGGGEHPQMPLEDDPVPLAVENLVSLMRHVNSAKPIARDVVAALDSARRAGGEDGSLQIELPARWAPEHGATLIDATVIDRHRAEPGSDLQAEHLTITGALHAIDLEPDEVAIRSPDGVDWACRYPSELEATVAGLVGQIVVAEGKGGGPRRDEARCVSMGWSLGSPSWHRWTEAQETRPRHSRQRRRASMPYLGPVGAETRKTSGTWQRCSSVSDRRSSSPRADGL